MSWQEKFFKSVLLTSLSCIHPCRECSHSSSSHGYPYPSIHDTSSSSFKGRCISKHSVLWLANVLLLLPLQLSFQPLVVATVPVQQAVNDSELNCYSTGAEEPVRLVRPSTFCLINEQILIWAATILLLVLVPPSIAVILLVIFVQVRVLITALSLLESVWLVVHLYLYTCIDTYVYSLELRREG